MEFRAFRMSFRSSTLGIAFPRRARSHSSYFSRHERNHFQLSRVSTKFYRKNHYHATVMRRNMMPNGHGVIIECTNTHTIDSLEPHMNHLTQFHLSLSQSISVLVLLPFVIYLFIIGGRMCLTVYLSTSSAN
jgi:hypothetical protein